MTTLLASLKRAWIDWTVCVFTVVAAASCKSPFLTLPFAAVAFAAAIFGARKTWRTAKLVREP